MLVSRATLLLVVLGLAHLGWSETVQETSQKILDNILGKYDARIRPAGVNGTSDNAPVIVSVNMYVRSINKVDDVNMEYKMQITLRQNWMDGRFKYDKANGVNYLTLNDPSKIWMPDLFFSNENEGRVHNLMTPNVFVRIHPNGNMQYSARLSLTLSCPMDLRWFPFDQQKCTARLASYGWTTDDLVFLWKELDPIQVVKSLSLPRFSLDVFKPDYCTSKTSTGEYSCLLLNLHLKREINFYLLHMFAPSVMLVVLSWVAFWFDHSAITARSLIGVTSLLAMSLQTLVFDTTLAPVSYTRSIDVWTGVCLTFQFAALLVTASVNYLSRADAKKRAKCAGQVVSSGDDEMDLKPLVKDSEAAVSDEQTSSVNNRQKEGTNFIRTWLTNTPTCWKRLDIMSRVLFPLGFAAFVIIYWITNLIHCSGED